MAARQTEKTKICYGETKVVALTSVPSPISMSTLKLEDNVDAAAQATLNENENESDDESSSDLGPIVCVGRHDCYLVGCQPPLSYRTEFSHEKLYHRIHNVNLPRMATIFGIVEDTIWWDTNHDPNNNNNPPLLDPQRIPRVDIHVKYFHPNSNQNDLAETQQETCACQPPYNHWNLAHRRQQQQLKGNPLSSPSTTEQENNIDMLWVDLRSASPQDIDLTTPGNVCYFLRSLLGSSHFASPWAPNNDKEEEEENRAFPVVAVLVPGYPQAMVDFRVNDACPSYFLHSVSKLELPPLPKEQEIGDYTWFQDYLDEDIDETTLSTLFVFRIMPPRNHLSIQHPKQQEQEEQTDLPFGCLWETVILNDDDNKGKDNDETLEQIPTSTTKTIIRPVSPPYVSHQEIFPNLLEPLLNHLDVIRQEALSIPQWTAWPETTHYSSSKGGSAADWTVFPLCHCFPANDVSHRKWIQTTSQFVPETTRLLQTLLGDTLRTALFSRLLAETTLGAQTGWKDLANFVYRIHIPLVVPPGDGLCGTWVDACVETHQEGHPVCFDDSKVHRAFNYSPHGDRILLILDLARPAHLPQGTATGGHTKELDQFIQTLT